RSLLLGGAFFPEAETQEEAFDARERIARGGVGALPIRGAFERKIALVFCGAREIIGMELPAELVKFALERDRVDCEFLWQREKRKIVRAFGQRLDFTARGAKMTRGKRRLAIPASGAGDYLRLGFCHTHGKSLATGYPSSIGLG